MADDGKALAPSAQIEEPPSVGKLELIHRFMNVIGLQGEIDSGSFLEYLALPGGPLSLEATEPGKRTATIEELFAPAMRSRLKPLYGEYRAEFQREYEEHINWEFTEEELGQIVSFLESPVGHHYLDGSWRMRAYVGTNTEPIIEKMIEEGGGVASPE
jgi:hypothetical protein